MNKIFIFNINVLKMLIKIDEDTFKIIFLHNKMRCNNFLFNFIIYYLYI